jgi:hypothetical protein
MIDEIAFKFKSGHAETKKENPPLSVQSVKNF